MVLCTSGAAFVLGMHMCMCGATVRGSGEAQ
jgi:hypothetical protein